MSIAHLFSKPLRPVFVICMMLGMTMAVAPVSAQQRLSTGDRLTALEQQLSAGRTGNVDLLNQISQLRTEMQALRGQIEELQQQLEQQKQLSRTQYLDLDSRLTRLEGGSASPPSTASATRAPTTQPAATSAATAAHTTTPAVPPVQDTAPRVYGDPATLAKGTDERSAYNSAFDALKGGRYAESARLFQGFLQTFPAGTYAPNAMYWLGESYYVTQNYALAQEQFQTLLNRYPTHDKTPGALLKIGLAQYGLRQLDAAEATLSQVIRLYPGSEAARTADDRLRAIQLSRAR